MREAIEQFLDTLRTKERYCEQEEEWQFPDGSAIATCTSSSILVAKRFCGIVLGYFSIENPAASIGSPNCEGHDFTLIDDRWLVDYWAWRVEALITTPIFDLSEEADREEVVRLYGTSLNWSLLEPNRIETDGRRLDPAREHPRAHNVPLHDAPRREW